MQANAIQLQATSAPGLPKVALLGNKAIADRYALRLQL